MISCSFILNGKLLIVKTEHILQILFSFTLPKNPTTHKISFLKDDYLNYSVHKPCYFNPI
jgi:hypothetical protein